MLLRIKEILESSSNSGNVFHDYHHQKSNFGCSVSHHIYQMDPKRVQSSFSPYCTTLKRKISSNVHYNHVNDDMARNGVIALSSAEKESPIAKFVISGVAAFGYELVIGHFLEFLKIAKQTNYEKSYMTLTREMVAKKGLVGILDGYFPWGAIQAVSKGAVFGFAHAAAATALRPFEESGSLNPQLGAILAGGIGGGFQGIVLSPLLLLKTRVMTDPAFRSDMNGWQTAKESARVGMSVISKEGPAALMKGSIVFSGKRVLDWSTRYMFAEFFELQFRKFAAKDSGLAENEVKLSTTTKTIASLLGGTVSALSTIPIDVMVAQIQQASKAGQTVSVREMFGSQMKDGGIIGMLRFSTRGFIARVAHVALTTALMKTGASFLYNQWTKVEGKLIAN